MDFNVILELTAGSSKAKLDFNFRCVVFTSETVCYCRDQFWAPLSKSRHLRGSIRHHVIKNIDFSVILELTVGRSKTNLEFQFVVWF